MRRKSVLYLSSLFLLPLVLAFFMIAQANTVTPASAAVGNVINPTNPAYCHRQPDTSTGRVYHSRTY